MKHKLSEAAGTVLVMAACGWLLAGMPGFWP